MQLIPVILIAVSLSMDAFSLSLLYGTLKMDRITNLKLSIIVGIYHFFMPLLGNVVGYTIINVLPIKPNFIVFMISFIFSICLQRYENFD